MKTTTQRRLNLSLTAFGHQADIRDGAAMAYAKRLARQGHSPVDIAGELNIAGVPANKSNELARAAEQLEAAGKVQS